MDPFLPKDPSLHICSFGDGTLGIGMVGWSSCLVPQPPKVPRPTATPPATATPTNLRRFLVDRRNRTFVGGSKRIKVGSPSQVGSMFHAELCRKASVCMLLHVPEVLWWFSYGLPPAKCALPNVDETIFELLFEQWRIISQPSISVRT